MAAKSLHSKLSRLFRKSYIVETPAADTLKEITGLLENGQHIVLSFGDFETDLDYLLVSNLLTCKLREVWVRLTDRYRKDGKDEPRQLVIVLEEATSSSTARWPHRRPFHHRAVSCASTT